MPLLDRRTNSVVLRIVYDGPPEAGKTTNLKHLCDRLSLSRRGTLESPGGQDRTQFFDWLDVTGGWVGGRRVQCQLVTVPGQIQLARRRRYILDSADVVVFVADSRASAAPETSAALRSLARGLGNRENVPLLLQANKQDLPGAQAPPDLHRALALPARVPVIGAHASSGTGVLETFMLAVRMAVDHVRALLLAGELGEGDAVNAAELLIALEADAPAAFPARDAITNAASAAVTVATSRDTGAVFVPPNGDVATGLVWPPLTGRAALRDLDVQRARGAQLIELDDSMIRCGTWLLCAHRDAWQDIDLARRALLSVLPRQPALADVVPATRALAVTEAGDGTYRLWQVAAVPRTLAELAELDRDAAAAAIERANRELLPRLTALAADGSLELTVGPSTIDATGSLYVGGAWLHKPGHRSSPLELAILGAVSAASEPASTRPASPEPAAERSVVIELGAKTAARAAADRRVPLGLPPPPEPLSFQLPPVDLPAGLVWPGVSGRAALAALAAPVRVATVTTSWAPAGAIELACGNGWLAHTSPELVFPELELGRPVLFEAVRWQARMAHFTPPGRTYALSSEADGARLWVLTSVRRTVWETVQEAFDRGDRATAGQVARRGLEAVDEIRARGMSIGDLDHITTDDPPRLLATPWTPERDRLTAQLQRLFAAAVL